MREIIFKAKRVDNGKWVEGDLIHGQGHKLGEMYILPQTQFYPHGCSDLDGWHVDPETVCQFTGLLDKNGKRIFEGDILRLDEYSCVETPVVFRDGMFCLKGFNWDKKKCEIIGNIHDKKEGK